MATISFTPEDDFILLAGNNTYKGGAGDDTYIVTQALMPNNAVATVSDTADDNVVQLVDHLTIASSTFYANRLELTLSNQAQIVVLNADKMEFELGANATIEDTAPRLDYAEFAAKLGVDKLPTGDAPANGEMNYVVAGNENTVTLSRNHSWVDETEPDNTVTYTVTLNTAAPAGGIIIPYTLEGTATPTADYTGSDESGQITIAAGKTSGSVTLKMVADATDEDEESITMNLGDLPSGYILNGEGTLTTHIEDTSNGGGGNENPTYTLTATPHTINETTSRAVTFTLTTTHIEDDTSIPYTLYGAGMDGSMGDVTDADFQEGLTGEFVVQNNQATVTLHAAADKTTEGTEMVLMMLDEGQATSPEITINDTSKGAMLGTMSLSQSASSVDETAPNNKVTYTITLSTPAPANGVVVPYVLDVSGSNASSNVDYKGSASSGNIIIAAGETTGSVTLTMTADEKTEGTEQIMCMVALPPTNYTWTGSNRVMTTINDTSTQSSTPTLRLSQYPATVDETAPHNKVTYVVVLSAAAKEDVQVAYTVGGSAKNGEDYKLNDESGLFTIAAGKKVGYITLTTIDDHLTENTENVIFTLGVLPTGYNLAPYSKNTVTTTLNDTSTAEVEASANSAEIGAVGFIPHMGIALF